MEKCLKIAINLKNCKICQFVCPADFFLIDFCFSVLSCYRASIKKRTLSAARLTVRAKNDTTKRLARCRDDTDMQLRYAKSHKLFKKRLRFTFSICRALILPKKTMFLYSWIFPAVHFLEKRARFTFSYFSNLISFQLLHVFMSVLKQLAKICYTLKNSILKDFFNFGKKCHNLKFCKTSNTILKFDEIISIFIFKKSINFAK